MDDCVQSQNVNPIHVMDSDQLLSAMTVADRDKRYDNFRKYRAEIMYRLRCAEPLINYSPPMRITD